MVAPGKEDPCKQNRTPSYTSAGRRGQATSAAGLASRSARSRWLGPRNGLAAFAFDARHSNWAAGPKFSGPSSAFPITIAKPFTNPERRGLARMCRQGDSDKWLRGRATAQTPTAHKCNRAHMRSTSFADRTTHRNTRTQITSLLRNDAAMRMFGARHAATLVPSSVHLQVWQRDSSRS